MDLIECIQSHFNIALKNYQYTETVKKITNIYYNIEYYIQGILIVIHIEIMESYFYIKIYANKKGNKYLISDKNYSDDYWRREQADLKDIFDFSSLDKDHFKRENIKLEKRAGRLFGTTAVQKRVVLYAKLIESSMSSILEWASN